HFPYFHGIRRWVNTGGNLEAVPVEPMHAREYIEFLAEQCFEALLTLMAGVNFNASVFDHS
ncbi:MAG: hypothetical protein KDD45_10115, partial [Bdellovibrionales bacterium]|nr:hypothetical protein [Bdellovibrionales bacterium]